MPATVPSAIAATMAAGSTRLVKMLRLALVDGTVMGFTDHDEDIAFDLLGLGEETYRAGTGILTSNIEHHAGFDPSTFEVTGPIGTAITLTAILGGRLRAARAHLFEVDWSMPEVGRIARAMGRVANATPAGSEFTLEIVTEAARFAQPTGRAITNNCDADHGDARCKRVPESDTLTVTAVTDAFAFEGTTPGTWADAYFDGGKLVWLTGALAGTWPVEVFRWTEDGAVTMWEPLAEAPQVGDTATIIRGCGKSRADCMARENMLNNRGHPSVPGSDQVLPPAIPGENGA